MMGTGPDVQRSAAQRSDEDEDEDEKNATRYFWIRAAVVGGGVHFVYFILQEFN